MSSNIPQLVNEHTSHCEQGTYFTKRSTGGALRQVILAIL